MCGELVQHCSCDRHSILCVLISIEGEDQITNLQKSMCLGQVLAIVSHGQRRCEGDIPSRMTNDRGDAFRNILQLRQCQNSSKVRKKDANHSSISTLNVLA